ncbi:hypothetical protein C1H76_9220 [Elsinoe australis]|uniref:Pierisin-like domain-containing protein n=1 Tax=Elsinoe australis TaxID=40998 RepID=A0A4U7APS9_9PEZI|nr:hypothetical protein C1H76_9220 [Elsinoe australis]
MHFSASQVFIFGLLALTTQARPADEPDTVYRKDTRTPGQIEDAGGFQTKAQTNNLPPNMNLRTHLMPPGGTVQGNSGFVSTTKDPKYANKWAGGGGYTYEIAKPPTEPKPPGYLDANKEVPDNKFSQQKEMSSMGNIPASQINSAQQVQRGKPVGPKVPMGKPSGSRG